MKIIKVGKKFEECSKDERRFHFMDSAIRGVVYKYDDCYGEYIPNDYVNGLIDLCETMGIEYDVRRFSTL